MLILAWTKMHRSRMVLELIIGTTQASLLDYLWVCTRILINVLSRMGDAWVKCPDMEKICEYQKSFQECHTSFGVPRMA